MPPLPLPAGEHVAVVSYGSGADHQTHTTSGTSLFDIAARCLRRWKETYGMFGPVVQLLDEEILIIDLLGGVHYEVLVGRVREWLGENR
jgi:hypothetical protein